MDGRAADRDGELPATRRVRCELSCLLLLVLCSAEEGMDGWMDG